MPRKTITQKLNNLEKFELNTAEIETILKYWISTHSQNKVKSLYISLNDMSGDIIKAEVVLDKKSTFKSF